MEYINKNIGGIWGAIPVCDATVKKIMAETFEKNTAIMGKVKKEMADFSEQERIAVFGTIARHYHYAVESFVSEKITEGVITKEDLLNGSIPEL